MSKTYCIIVSYNAMPWIERCLHSIKGQAEVILVDNNSKDETVLFVKSKFPNVLIFPQDTNLGFGKANNLGISEALKSGASHVFLLNQDVYIEGNAITKLVEFSIKNKEYGILSPIHYNGEGTGLDFQFKKYLTTSHSYSNSFLEKESKPEVLDVLFVNAAAWLLSKDCLSIIGGFDPLFFHYGEDENYCQRARFHNVKIGIANFAFIKHDREKREINEKVAFSEKYFTAYKKFIALKYANINLPFSKKAYKEEFAKSKKNILKSLLKFNLPHAKGNCKKLSLAKKTEIEIMASRSTNIKKGYHYIP